MLLLSCEVKGKVGDSFKVITEVRHSIMLSCMFNLFMDGVVREMKANVGYADMEIYTDNVKRKCNTIIFTDDTVLISDN